MTETYSLKEKLLPVIPTPHDCQITAIEEQGESICFRFEEKNLAAHDAIRVRHPAATKLTMCFHMDAEDQPMFQLLEQKTHREEDIYEVRKYKRLFKLTDAYKKLTYQYHYVASGQIIITMASGSTGIQLSFSADEVTMTWTE